MPEDTPRKKTYLKHLVECNCVLPQFQNRRPVVFHRFVVFSVIDEKGNVETSQACCNNCGAVHKIIEIGVSERLPREESALAPKISDFKYSLPEGMRELLLSYKVPLDVWQEAAFIVENEDWGKSIILSREESAEKETVSGKRLHIMGTTLFRVIPFDYTNLVGITDDDE